jgi:hypothetical protein
VVGIDSFSRKIPLIYAVYRSLAAQFKGAIGKRSRGEKDAFSSTLLALFCRPGDRRQCIYQAGKANFGYFLSTIYCGSRFDDFLTNQIQE